MHRVEHSFLARQLKLGLSGLRLLPLITDPALQPANRVDALRWLLLWGLVPRVCLGDLAVAAGPGVAIPDPCC